VRCGVGEVLVIAHARYGRMRISRCVREHFGYVDCSVDVADVLDRHRAESYWIGTARDDGRAASGYWTTTSTTSGRATTTSRATSRSVTTASRVRFISSARSPHLLKSSSSLSCGLSKNGRCRFHEQPPCLSGWTMQ